MQTPTSDPNLRNQSDVDLASYTGSILLQWVNNQFWQMFLAPLSILSGLMQTPSRGLREAAMTLQRSFLRLDLLANRKS